MPCPSPSPALTVVKEYAAAAAADPAWDSKMKKVEEEERCYHQEHRWMVRRVVPSWMPPDRAEN